MSEKQAKFLENALLVINSTLLVGVPFIILLRYRLTARWIIPLFFTAAMSMVISFLLGDTTRKIVTSVSLTGLLCNFSAIAANSWMMPVSMHFSPHGLCRPMLPTDHLKLLYDVLWGSSIGDMLLFLGLIMAAIVSREMKQKSA